MSGFRPLDALGVAFLLVGPVALVLRRANRPAALAVTALATITYFLVGYAFGPVFLPLFVALATTIVGGHRRAAYGIIGATFVVLLAYHLVRTGGDPAIWTGAAFWLAVLVAVVGASEGIRARRERTAAAAATEAETDRRRGVQERLRIAQELHDVLGHHVSLINVQAGVALYLLDDDPEQARTALAAIKQSSRDLLREMRSTLGVLRAVDEAPPHHPVPGIDRLDALADDVRAAGLPVEVRDQRRAAGAAAERRPGRVPDRAGGAHERPPARRRRPARRCGWPTSSDGLTVQVDDDGAGTAAAVRRAGRRERAARDAGAGHRARRVAWRPGRCPAGGSGCGPRCPPGRGAVTVIGVLLADDQALVRAGFRALLRPQPDMQVVAEAEDGAAAVKLAREHRPDVVLMDIRMPGTDGLAATKEIAADPKLADVKVIVLTTFTEDSYVFDAIRFGASGFLVKDIEPAELIHAIRVVHRGDALLAPAVTRTLIEEFAARARAVRPDRRLRRADRLADRAGARGRHARRGRADQRRDRHGRCSSARPPRRRTSAGRW